MYEQMANFPESERVAIAVPVQRKLENLEGWAAKRPQASEIYPNYWVLRGWHCVHAPLGLTH
jgi:hypothetical protein